MRRSLVPAIEHIGYARAPLERLSMGVHDCASGGMCRSGGDSKGRSKLFHSEEEVAGA